MTTVSANKFPRKLFFFESVKFEKFQTVFAITFLLGNENQAAKTSQCPNVSATPIGQMGFEIG